MQRIDVEHSIIRLLSEQFYRNDITPDTHLRDDLSVDSLDAVEIAMSVEDEHLIVVPDEVFEGFKTVRDIIDHAYTEIQKQTEPSESGV